MNTLPKLTLALMLPLVLSALVSCQQATETLVDADTEEAAVIEKINEWQIQYDLGMKYLSEGNYEEAIIAFTAAIELEPKNADAYLGMAEVYIAQNDFDAAIAILEQGLAEVNDEALQARLDELYEGNVSDFWGNTRQMSYYDESGELQYYHMYDYEDGVRTLVTSYDGVGNQTGQVEILYDDVDNLVQWYSWSTYGDDIVVGQVKKLALEYDDNGNCTKKIYHDGIGEVSFYTTMEYDGELLIKETQYDSDGGIECTDTYSYLEDGTIRSDYYRYNQEDENQSYSLQKFNDDGAIIEYATYEMDDALISYDIYERDDDGNLISLTSYDADGNITNTTTYN